jgi:hypothetical protein
MLEAVLQYSSTCIDCKCSEDKFLTGIIIISCLNIFLFYTLLTGMMIVFLA